ncbi:VanZ family protein [bacterium]|nr:VanZ family protein [bacterium]
MFKSPRSEALAQYILFAILVVLTPFIVVTRYLQGVVHLVSHLSFSVFGIEVPYVLMAAGAGLIVMIVWQAKNINRRRITAIIISLLLILFAHNTMDVYLDMSFFDLQQNWHYFAYGAYAFYFFRAFNVRKMPKNKMILYSFLSAMGMSLFDETFQFFMSDRVFDISDITKDALGVYIGIILVLFVTETYGAIDLKKHSAVHREIKNYLSEPLSTLILLGVLTISFVIISPLLTEHEYWHMVLIGGFSLFAFFMVIIHLSQFKTARFVMIAAVILLTSGLAVSYAINSKKNITFNAHGLTIYKGLPLPFFDIIIYPNSCFHLIDKKHFFRPQDKKYLQKQEPDIILIGSGSMGKGGKGFDVETGTYFMFNHFTMKGTQLIILPTPEACEKFNELKKAGKSVLFVIHNTC